jgi:hypothetical protein
MAAGVAVTAFSACGIVAPDQLRKLFTQSIRVMELCISFVSTHNTKHSISSSSHLIEMKRRLNLIEEKDLNMIERKDTHLIEKKRNLNLKRKGISI